MICKKTLDIGDEVIFLDYVGQYGKLHKGTIYRETDASWIICYTTDYSNGCMKVMSKNRRERIYKLN